MNTSLGFAIKTNTPKETLQFMNRHEVKNFKNWRLPTSNELKEEDLIGQILAAGIDLLWCLDAHTKALSVFDTRLARHEKCNTRESLEHMLALVALGDQEDDQNQEGMEVVFFGDLGLHATAWPWREWPFPLDLVTELNRLNYSGLAEWRIPSKDELMAIRAKQPDLSMPEGAVVWSNTEPKKFYVETVNWESGESELRKRRSTMEQVRATALLVADPIGRNGKPKTPEANSTNSKASKSTKQPKSKWSLRSIFKSS